MIRPLAMLAAVGAAFLGLAVAARGEVTPPPPVGARAVLVGNGATGEVLYSRDAGRRLPIASITKVMTALVALEQVGSNELVRVADPASGVAGSTIYVRVGERFRVRDLLAAVLIQSANDAAYALAAHVGRGSAPAFVRLMNAKARELGLADTRFVRPDGLDAEGHYSTARDLFKLARQAMRKPLIREFVATRSVTIAGGRRLSNWNDLLGRYRGLFGVKTGHTRAAGWNEVAAARRGGVTIYAVILGSPGREQRNADLVKLLDWGFDQYRRVTVIRPGRTYAEAVVPFSDEPLRLVATEPALALVHVGHPLVERVVAPLLVPLPVLKGQRLGEVRVLAGKKVIASRPLVATESIASPSLGRRFDWYAARALDDAGGMIESLAGAVW